MHKEITKKGLTAPSFNMNFTIKEFECNDGTPVPLKFVPNVTELIENLEVIRAELNKDSEEEICLLVLSGYRTKEYNDKVGGKEHSYHLSAQASDLRAFYKKSKKVISPKSLHKTILNLINLGKIKQGGLGLYETFVHYDIRGFKSRW